MTMLRICFAMFVAVSAEILESGGGFAGGDRTTQSPESWMNLNPAAHLLFLETQANVENEIHMQTNFIMQNSRARLMDTLATRKDRLDKLRTALVHINDPINDDLALIATYLQALDNRIKIAILVILGFTFLYLVLGLVL